DEPAEQVGQLLVRPDDGAGPTAAEGDVAAEQSVPLTRQEQLVRPPADLAATPLAPAREAAGLPRSSRVRTCAYRGPLSDHSARACPACPGHAPGTHISPRRDTRPCRS